MAAYLKALEEHPNALAAKSSAEGVTRKQRPAGSVDGMLPAANLELIILEKLKGKPGGVSLIDVLASLSVRGKSYSAQERRLAKAEFDKAVLSLYKDRRVYLDRHDHPMRLTDTERRDLVSDGDGNYYVGITLRGDNE